MKLVIGSLKVTAQGNLPHALYRNTDTVKLRLGGIAGRIADDRTLYVQTGIDHIKRRGTGIVGQ